MIDETHDPARRSFVASANLADAAFPLQNLPLGIFSAQDGTKRFGIAIGDRILDVSAAEEAGLLQGDAAIAARAGRAGNLNGVFSLGQPVLNALRSQVSDLLDADSQSRSEIEQGLLHPMTDCQLHLPADTRNYTDFFAGIHHARAAGALLTPDNPLPQNYKYVPIAYHGRASSVRVSGGEIRRPNGQRPRGSGRHPEFGPCERLDLELELGFYIGNGNALGAPIPAGQARGHIAGLCLLNDWSARDIQRWEMQPLGPFLSKSFSTTVSPWVVTLGALEPFRIPAFDRPQGDPAPLAYLQDPDDQAAGGFDIDLAVLLRTAAMRRDGQSAETIITSNARHLYWTLSQMVTHHSSNGCNLLAGDLVGTGTISGPTRAELSSMLELTNGGTEPAKLANGEERGFLADGDEITLTATCRREGFVSIGFGSAVGTIVA